MATPRIVRDYKHGWPRRAVGMLIHSKLRKAFHRVHAQGMERLAASAEAEPAGTLLLANHSCWWDVFFAIYLYEFHVIPFDGYGMMEHFNMLRFGFFRRIGAFSVDRTDPAAVRESIAHAASILARPRAAIWVFPQGRMVGPAVRPLGFQRGLSAIVARAGRVRLVPVAFRYEFWQEERPEAFVRFGAPEWADRSSRHSVVERMEARVTAELDALDLDVASQEAGRFEAVMSGPTSINERYASLRARFRGPTPGAPA